MAVQTSYPGVYIDEFAPGAPIQGVSTSIAAFLGPTQRGVIASQLTRPEVEEELTRVTSWDGFLAAYGERPAQGFHLWHAVRGFFANGGRVCYVARVSNGTYATLNIPTAAGPNALRVRAEQPGAGALEVRLTNNPVLAGLSLYQPVSAVNAVTSPRELVMNNAGEAARFRPGDVVAYDSGGVVTGRVVVARVSQANIFLAAPLAGVAAGDNLRLADLTAGTREIRVAPAAWPPAPFPTVETADGQEIQALTLGTVLTLDDGGGGTDTVVVDSVSTENFNDGAVRRTYRVTLRDGLNQAFDMAAPVAVDSLEFDFDIRVGGAGGTVTSFTQLGYDTAHPRHYARILNANPDVPVRVSPAEPPPALPLPANLPADLGWTALAGGANENLAGLTSAHFTAALDVLERIDDISLIAAPDAASAAAAGVDRNTVQQAMIGHCERLADRFAVLDSGRDRTISGANSVEIQRSALDSARGYAGLYFPWLKVAPVSSGPPVLVPPSGHVCGIMARSDASRGVHKAPANEIVRDSLGVQHALSDVEQGLLNLQGINVIRVFAQGGRPVVWGARTTATDTNWQYVSTRRLFLFLEESIQDGIRWAVFEPNNLALWQKLRRTIGAFLMTQWRAGALFGEAPEDAFYVRIDEVLNPFSEQQLGRLHMEIGVRPAFPAEFIIVRIGIWDGGAEVSEG